MQRFIATIMMFFLAAVSVLPGMDVHEAEKLPDLIRHYRHHLAEAPSSVQVGPDTRNRNTSPCP